MRTPAGTRSSGHGRAPLAVQRSSEVTAGRPLNRRQQPNQTSHRKTGRKVIRPPPHPLDLGKTQIGKQNWTKKNSRRKGRNRPEKTKKQNTPTQLHTLLLAAVPRKGNSG
ncbi:hypothetical protein RHMOL_Rhmol07G0099600 [Rhododendron molle]|uniref:Uncharacterized protein n=1 Tax=Rhododendron molle TaxID=49168 RepID=A0ACC0MZN8_RHOML|nr:hypothetical protein RHMOL_Rhmol07G0099600 [Rhododendron molle]